MIDTLKLARRLTAAHMPAEQAEALSEGLAESLKEAYVTREFLDARRAEDRAYLDTRLAALRTELVMWMVGTVGLATLINHWWK
jgi:hypothetical protein